MLRDLTRYRVDLVGVRTAEKQRVEKLLEDAWIKLSVVASDIFGVSGREMMAALIAGQRDPKVLAEMARGRMRAKIAAAGGGVHRPVHRPSRRSCWPRCWPAIDAIDADIADLDARIEAQMAPFADAVARLDEIPGIGPTAAAVIIAEIGVDMTRFPTAAHLCLVGEVRPRDQGVRRPEEGQRGHRARQPLPGPGARRGRRQRRPDRHLPRRALPADRPPPRQEEGHRRGRPIHPGDHLAPARPTPTPGSTTSAPTTTTPASTPNAANRNHIRQLEALGYKVTLEPAA